MWGPLPVLFHQSYIEIYDLTILLSFFKLYFLSLTSVDAFLTRPQRLLLIKIDESFSIFAFLRVVLLEECEPLIQWAEDHPDCCP